MGYRSIEHKLASVILFLGAVAVGPPTLAGPTAVMMTPTAATRATTVSGNQPPTLLVPQEMSVTQGIPSDLKVSATDPDLMDSLWVSVQGLPPGLQAVAGRQEKGLIEVRIYGIPQDAATATAYQVQWSASDGTSHQVAMSRVHVESSQPDPEFENEVMKFYTAEYFHGLPRMKARALGRRSLPILARLLRDPSAKQYWHQVAAGIGFVGDTAYFDTLRSFVWDRFHGPVDFRTYMGLMQAQASLGAMATLSTQVRAYLETVAQPGAWDTLPWHSPPPDSRESVGRRMRRMTIGSISYTDSDWATALLSEIPVPERDADMAEAVATGREVNNKVRLGGLAKLWAEQDRKR